MATDQDIGENIHWLWQELMEGYMRLMELCKKRKRAIEEGEAMETATRSWKGGQGGRCGRLYRPSSLWRQIYLGGDDISPQWPDWRFRRSFRLPRDVFQKILQECDSPLMGKLVNCNRYAFAADIRILACLRYLGSQGW